MNSYQEGCDAYERGDYETALKEFRPLADQGDPLAQATLGLMYAEGEGVAQDYQEAVRWYRLAAEQGHASGQFSLGGHVCRRPGRAERLRSGPYVVKTGSSQKSKKGGQGA